MSAELREYERAVCQDGRSIDQEASILRAVSPDFLRSFRSIQTRKDRDVFYLAIYVVGDEWFLFQNIKGTKVLLVN